MSNTFQWTDELAIEFAKAWWMSATLDQAALEAFKASREKQWEVVAFGEKAGEIIHYYKLQPDGRYRNEALHSELSWPAHSFINDNESIHSIRRLSDGLILTVLDWIRPNAAHHPIQITKFTATENVLRIHNKDGYFVSGEQYWEQMQKLPTPLFTTTDGREIYPGQEFWSVSEDYFIDPEKAKESERGEWNNAITFSTREAAENWIVDNAPRLSVKDVEEACEHLYASSKDIVIKKAIEIVKSKMK